MSADIETRTDGSSASLVADWVTPWHRVGDMVGMCRVAEMWDRLPKIAARVNAEPMYLGDGTLITDRVANVREAAVRLTPEGVTSIPRKYLATVSDTYRIVQNRDAFEFLTDIDRLNDQVRVASAGSLADGCVSWIALHLGADVLIPGDPEMTTRNRYMLFVNSFDGSTSFKVITTSVLVVCANTLQAATAEGQRVVGIRHTKNAADRLQDARMVLGIADRNAAHEAEVAERFAATRVTDSEFTGMLDHLFPMDTDDPRAASRQQNRRDAVDVIYRTSPTVGGYHGTAWGAFNAVTGWDEHERKQKPESRFQTTLVSGNKASKAAFGYLNALAAA